MPGLPVNYEKLRLSERAVAQLVRMPARACLTVLGHPRDRFPAPED